MEHLALLINFLTDLKEDISLIKDISDQHTITIKKQLIGDVDYILNKCFDNNLDSVIDAYMDRWLGPCIVRELDIDQDLKKLILADWKVVGIYLYRYIQNM